MWRGTAAARLLLRACASSPVLQQHTQQLLPPLQSASGPAILLPVTRWIQTKAALTSHGGGAGGGGQLDEFGIATGAEREELEAKREGKKRFDLDPPRGPFGTHVRCWSLWLWAWSVKLLSCKARPTIFYSVCDLYCRFLFSTCQEL
jgi:hypothetical protein